MERGLVMRQTGLLSDAVNMKLNAEGASLWHLVGKE